MTFCLEGSWLHTLIRNVLSHILKRERSVTLPERFATLLEDDWIRHVSIRNNLCHIVNVLSHFLNVLQHILNAGHKFSKGYALIFDEISWINFGKIPVDFRFDWPELEVRIWTGSSGVTEISVGY